MAEKKIIPVKNEAGEVIGEVLTASQDPNGPVIVEMVINNRRRHSERRFGNDPLRDDGARRVAEVLERTAKGTKDHFKDDQPHADLTKYFVRFGGDDLQLLHNDPNCDDIVVPSGWHGDQVAVQTIMDAIEDHDQAGS